MNTATLPNAAAHPLRQDLKTISLVGLAHGTSHFFHMLLPPLFPVFIHEFGLSYAELGLLVTVFFAISGVGQALAGFLVDRVGARPVLFVALFCFVMASAAAALSQGLGGLALAAALAGLGNSPFHPADFTILNKRVSSPRLGHAFSAHGISGNLGWALAPVFLLGLTALSGHWRWAYGGAGFLALGVMALLFIHREAINDRHLAKPAAPATPAASVATPAAPQAVASVEHPLAFLRLPSLWLCFSFFFFTTAALSAVQSFSAPALASLYGLPPTVTAYVVTGYMLFGALGMIVGGFWVAHSGRLERQIALAMGGAAALFLLTGSGGLSPSLAVFFTALAGLGTGLAGPSRDMLIRRAAPPGATGRVYGVVYSGLDLGFALAAPVFGALLDHHLPGAVFQGAALALMLGTGAAGVVAWAGRV